MTILPSVAQPQAAEPLLDDLISIMAQQETLCGRLLKIAMSERDLLADGKVEELEAASREKTGLIEQMERLETRRGATTRAICRLLGLSEAAPLRNLTATLSGPRRTALEDARDRITKLVAALREANDCNQELMKRSLDAVRDSLRNLRRLAGTGEIYDSGGQSHWSGTGMMALDRRA